MTVDSARAWLWVTVAVTFTASTLFVLLRVYARGRSVHWKWSDWLNGKLALLNMFAAATNMDGSLGICRVPSLV